MRLCSQCRYSFVPLGDRLPRALFPELYDMRCSHEKGTDRSAPSAVDGRVIERFYPCHYMRGTTEPCGKEGKLWEPSLGYTVLRLLRIIK